MTKVLLVDRSGRGHAIADLLSRTNKDTTVYYAPGCAAIETERVISLPQLTLSDPLRMVEFAKQASIDFAMVSNVVALASGVVDVFRANHIPVIGPDRQASRLESSKIYGKQLCVKYGLPVATSSYFDDPDAAKSYVRSVPYQVVVKADGLCGGNGSFVCDSVEDAVQAIDKLMVSRVFEEAGDRVVIEERLFGKELSFFALLDGRDFKILPMALDYPKSDDGNMGITCGGMGALSPHPLEDADLIRKAETQILQPLMECIRQEGLKYNGVLYAGCMLVGDKLFVLEINVRMGDPEAEVVLPRIESDFVAICKSILERSLDHRPLSLNDLYYCDVVATQGKTRQIVKGKNKGWYTGWPFGRYGKYYQIEGLDRLDPAQCRLFIGEASLHPEKGLVSDGGRVIHVVGFGTTHQDAVENAYSNIKHIQFKGIRYRSDIGIVLPWSNGSHQDPVTEGLND